MLKLVEEEDGRLGAMIRVFQRQSMIDIDRILNARFPQGSVSFPDAVGHDGDSVVSTIVAQGSGAHAAPAAAGASEPRFQLVCRRVGTTVRGATKAKGCRPTSCHQKQAAAVASSSSSSAQTRAFELKDFNVEWFDETTVNVTYDKTGETKSVKVTSPAFRAAFQGVTQTTFEEFVQRVKVVIQSITDIETLEAAKLATRQQIHHELCANKKDYANFKLLAGVKGTFKFADAWKYLTQRSTAARQ